jgi:hypothetical protein
MRFKITRVYVVEAASKADALAQLQQAVANGTDLDLQDVEFVRVLAEPDGTTANAWLQAFKAQLL